MSKGTVLVVGSNADRFELKAGKVLPTGYYLNELAIPAMAVIEAGYDIVLATPDGSQPVMDEASRSASHFGNSEGALQAALDFVATHPAMQKPRSLRSVIADGLDPYAGVFVPGGHAPMVDLMQDPDLGEILRYFHAHAKPTALLCHGPMAVVAAMPKAKAFRAALAAGDVQGAQLAAQGWQYAGYRMTVFSNKEEEVVEEQVFKGRLPFHAADALQAAGGVLAGNDALFQSNVVQDRELITGQNPASDHALATALLKALDNKDKDGSQ